jgi:hypothetical protein
VYDPKERYGPYMAAMKVRFLLHALCARVVQLAEYLLDMEKVGGSNPSASMHSEALLATAGTLWTY